MRLHGAGVGGRTFGAITLKAGEAHCASRVFPIVRWLGDFCFNALDLIADLLESVEILLLELPP